MRQLIIAGNWKINKTLGEAVELVTALHAQFANLKSIDIVLCPPAINLQAAHLIVKDSAISLGAQNMHWEPAGAFTGELSAGMLKSVGCEYVIIGHSERRQYFGETDETVNKKVHRAVNEDLLPIMCIGETLAQREGGLTEKVLETQIRGGLKDISAEKMKSVIIAYEPIWAIGTGKTATTEQAQSAHKFIRDLIREMYSSELADGLRIQYGGSVKPENAKELLSQPDVDGALVGGASLKADSFAGIINANF